MADAPLAPLNNAYKFFIANVDFQTTASQVRQFFSAFGNVNHVKLIPHASSSSYSSGSGVSGDTAVGGAGEEGGGRQRHKGYGFLFMIDEPSTLAVERYVNAFPENKIEMLGRKGVFVKRQVGMGRDGEGRNTNAGRGNINTNNNSDYGTNYQHSWGQYLDYNAQQMHFNTTASTTTATVNGTNATYPQQLQTGMTQSSQGSSDHYAMQVPYPQQQQQQWQSENVQAPQHLHYSGSSIQSTSSSLPTAYLPQQFPSGSIYPAAYQGNFQAVPQQSPEQHVAQQQTVTYHTPMMYTNQAPLQLPLTATATSLGYCQTSHGLPPTSQNIQLNRWDQWQQQQQQQPQRSMRPLHHPMCGEAGGGGKWNGGGMMGGLHRGMGGREGGGRGNFAGRGGSTGADAATAYGGRNGRDGRRDRPY